MQEILEFFPGLACCYRNNEITLMNSTGARMLGYDDPETLSGKAFDSLLSDECRGIELIEQTCKDGVSCGTHLQQPNGGQIAVEITVEWCRELGPNTMIIRAEDISQRMDLSSDVIKAANRFQGLVDNAVDMICGCEGGKVTYLNRAGMKLLNAQIDTPVIGLPIEALFHKDYGAIFEEPEILASLFEEAELFPARMACFNGDFVDVQVSLKMAENDFKDFMLEIRDISEHRKAVMALHSMNQELEQRVKDRTAALTDEVERRREAEDQMRHMATHDGLTGLPNRSLLFDRLEAAIHRSHRENNKTALLFIDLDGFKAVNDTFGHDAGDEVLKVVASQLLVLSRETDTVARLGGDEFVILYTDIHESAEASFLAERILKSFSHPIPLPGGDEGDIGCSIGISVYPDNGTDAATILKVADNLMYDVKKAGKNNYLLAK